MGTLFAPKQGIVIVIVIANLQVHTGGDIRKRRCPLHTRGGTIDILEFTREEPGVYSPL